MQIPHKSTRRQVYLLRCWAELDRAAAGQWRFSLEEPRTGIRRGFTSLEALVACLADTLAKAEDEPLADEAPQSDDAP